MEDVEMAVVRADKEADEEEELRDVELAEDEVVVGGVGMLQPD